MKNATALFFLLFLILSTSAIGQNAHKLRAVFVYNFSRYIAWPNGYKAGDFVIVTLGKSDIDRELKNIAARKKAGSQKIVIKTAGSVSELSSYIATQKCHILYVSSALSKKMTSINKAVAGKSILIITNNDGLAKGKNGSAINFVLRNNKQKFELNEGNAKKRGLKIDKKLKKLSIEVN